MPNEQHLLTVALGGKLLQETTHPHRYLLVTLAAGEWHANGCCAGKFHVRARAPLKVSVVARTQPCVAQDGYRATYEDEARGVIGALGVGRIHDIEVLASVAGA
jgi:hypothetical protein